MLAFQTQISGITIKNRGLEKFDAKMATGCRVSLTSALFLSAPPSLFSSQDRHPDIAVILWMTELSEKKEKIASCLVTSFPSKGILDPISNKREGK